ncbi:class I SAM-dependent methyltransferase [Microtetraspora niveoalba]|uniref:class I SAM-dependent methyltransferase n=1 Tax=Microtetraspora niveoalba TaxID=46175 RepID=UPI00082F1A25|nr:class I SAM-dependent methyltransferase [Microtetraspora niveoalba]
MPTTRRLVVAAAAVGALTLATLTVLILLEILEILAGLTLGLLTCAIGLMFLVTLSVRRLDGKALRIDGRVKRQEAALAKVADALAQVAARLDQAGAATDTHGSRRDEDLRAILASLGEDRVNTMLARQEIDDAVGGVGTLVESVGARLDGVEKALTGEVRRGYRQIEAYVDLRALIEPRAPLPAPGSAALLNNAPLNTGPVSTAPPSTGPDVLRRLVEHICADRPGLVVACGGGSSSVWLGYAVERFGGGRVVALEHDGRCAQLSRDLVRAHGLDHVVEVRHAPLRPWRLGAESWDWYDEDATRDLDGIGLLLVDGPPGATGRQSRYPAVPALLDRCAKDARIVLDDDPGADEWSVVSRWLEEFPLEATDHEAGTGLVTLRLATP